MKVLFVSLLLCLFCSAQAQQHLTNQDVINLVKSGLAGGQLRKGDLDRRSPFFATGNDQVNSFMYFEATPE